MNMPEDTNLASEASATRWIPASVIPPFNVIGIPQVQHETKCAKIVKAVESLADHFSKWTKRNPNVFGDRDYSVDFEWIAKSFGAEDALSELISTTQGSQLYSVDFYISKAGEQYHLLIYVFK